MTVPTDKASSQGDGLDAGANVRTAPDDVRLETTTQEILSGALRRADVVNHRELAQSIAPLLTAALRKEIGAVPSAPGDAPAPASRASLRTRAFAWRDKLAAPDWRQSWRLRARSLMIGQPVADIQRELEQRPKLRSLQTIERATGRVIARWRAEGLSAELTTNLIAAIRAFVAKEFASPHDESRVMNFRSSRVLLRASESLVVAAEYASDPHPEDKARMDRALQALLRNDEAAPDDRQLARIAAGPTHLPVARAPLAWALAAALLFLAIAAAFTLYRRDDPWDKRLQDALASEREAQPSLADWPLNLSLDKDAGVATLSGFAPAKADLDAVSRALEAADPRYRLQMRVTRLETAAAATAREAQLTERMTALAEQAHATQGRLEELQKWQADRQAEHDSPTAQLERLASSTVIRFGDEDDFLDAEQARRDLVALAWALKASGGSLRVVGYTDSHGSAPMNRHLSRIRAKAVIDALVGEGVEAEKLVAVGRAAEAPIAGESGADRRRNRRVIFELLGAGEQEP